MDTVVWIIAIVILSVILIFSMLFCTVFSIGLVKSMLEEWDEELEEDNS